VLRGEMAIVGPRPTLAAQVADYTPEQRRRLEVW
jgi:lipopolysaccharide/colanic/teichoic acid biosynthesis glycosyltransferase